MYKGQTSLLDEIIVDNFAGGGGLWGAYHPKAFFSGGPVRRTACCVAGTDPRAGGQPGG